MAGWLGSSLQFCGHTKVSLRVRVLRAIKGHNAISLIIWEVVRVGDFVPVGGLGSVAAAWG